MPGFGRLAVPWLFRHMAPLLKLSQPDEPSMRTAHVSTRELCPNPPLQAGKRILCDLPAWQNAALTVFIAWPIRNYAGQRPRRHLVVRHCSMLIQQTRVTTNLN